MRNLLTEREIDLLLAAIKGHQCPEGKRWVATFSVSEVAEVQRKLEAKKQEGA
jgi:hypothetical protein